MPWLACEVAEGPEGKTPLGCSSSGSAGLVGRLGQALQQQLAHIVITGRKMERCHRGEGSERADGRD